MIEDMKKIFIALLLILNLTGCGKWIDLEPQTMVTYTNFFKTEADAEALLVGTMCNTKLAFCSGSPSRHAIIGDIIDKVGREFSWNINSNELRKLSSFQISDESCDSWKIYYEIIQSANVLIDEEYRFTENKQISRERLDFYLQQAHFFKALGYFMVARTWGDAPIIPNHKHTEKLGRSPKEAVIAEAIRCAEVAFELPDYDKIIDCNGKIVASKMWASKGAAAALLADIYAWRGAISNNVDDTKKAIDYCTNIIEGKYGTYSCAGSPKAVCENVLSERRNIESIWEIDFFFSDARFIFTFMEDNSHNIYPNSRYFIGFPLNGYKTQKSTMRYAIYAKTINALYENQDLRRTEYFSEIDTPVSGVEEDVRIAYVNKFRKPYIMQSQYDPIGYVNIDANRVYYRAAGIILLRAECRNRAGDESGAISDINTIRGYANAVTYPNGNCDNKNLAYSIFQEWTKEFIFERERYYDVVRNGLWKTDMNPTFPVLSESDVKNGALYMPMGKYAIRGDNDLLIETPFWNGRK